MELKKSKLSIEFSVGKNELIMLFSIPILGLIALSLLYFFNPLNVSILPKCFILSMTHLYCPGCGATRATYFLIHGNIIKAFGYNQLYIISLPFLIYLYLLCFGIKINKKNLIPIMPINIKTCLVIGIIIISFTVFRNIPVYPFNLLAP